MSTAIVFRNNFLSLQQYAAVSLRFTLKTKPTLYLTILPLLSVIIFWSQFPWTSSNWVETLQDAGPFIWLMTLLMLWLPFSMWRGIKKNYTTTRFLQTAVDYEFSAAGMELKSVLTHSQTAWEGFESFYDFGRHGVLLTSTASGFFLDFNSLQSPFVKTDFLNLLQAHQLPVR